jgi:hypothetical protein
VAFRREEGIDMTSKGRSEGTSPDEFVERLKVLVGENIAGSRQLVTRLRNIVREADQAVSAGAAGDRTDPKELLFRWLDFNLASYSVVNTHGLALLNGLLSAAQGTLIPEPAAARQSHPAAAPRVDLRLSGRHGERAATGFVIENQFDEPLSVTFESSPLAPATGARLPASLVSFEPPTLVVEPRRQGVVQAVVTITSDFVVGQTYATTIRPLGFEAKELALSITILPVARGAGQSGPAPTEAGSSQ